jgi:hypothetical protein
VILKDRQRFTNFQTFIGVAARSHGFRVIEVETLFQSREVGESFLTAKKIRSVLLTTFRDLIVGLSIYRFSRVSYEFNSPKDNVANNMGLLRKVRFDLFFLTMPLHKWIIGRNSKFLYFWLKNTEFCTTEE